jgi:hypothetical protein
MRSTTALLACAAGILFAGCGSSSNGSPDMSAAMCTNGGGPATGAQDTHCVMGDMGLQLITADPAQCSVDAGPSSGPPYGDTMYNSSGYDDDCKYFVSYTVDPICENIGVNFVVTVKDAITMKPITGINTSPNKLRAEVFLSDTHPANVSGVMTSETSTGVYKTGPIVFDAKGMWTVRFHFFENCVDQPNSPHGHAAFYVNVP